MARQGSSRVLPRSLRSKYLGVTPLYGITTVGLRDEESVWYGIAYLGSRLAVGALLATELDQQHTGPGRSGRANGAPGR